jgi:hypothetical protein
MTRWRVALVAAAVLLIAGTVVYLQADSEGLQSVGFGIFLAAVALFILARVMILRGGRAR